MVRVVYSSSGPCGYRTTSGFAFFQLGTGGAISAPPEIILSWAFLSGVTELLEIIFRKGGADLRPAIHTAAVLPAEDEVCHDACRGITTFSEFF